MARMGQLEAVKILLDLRADVKLKNQRGKTALREAFEGKYHALHNPESIFSRLFGDRLFWEKWTSFGKALLDHGSSLEERDPNDVSVWEIALTALNDVNRDLIAYGDFLKMLKSYRK